MGPKKGLKSGSYTAAMSEQLKEDGITDILARVVFRKGILSLPFRHQQTWLERGASQFGRQSNQSPFSPDIYICSPPLMDLEALSQFQCGLGGKHQSSDFFKSIMNGLKGFCQVSNLDGCVILACKSKAGREWHHLRGRLDGSFFDVLGYLQQAGRPCWRDIKRSDASWYLQDPAAFTWESLNQFIQRTHTSTPHQIICFCLFVILFSPT